MASLLDWVVMCAETPELVRQYNRLRGTSLSFVPIFPRDAISALIDQACNFNAVVRNNPDEIAQFVAHCVELSPWRRSFTALT